MQDLAPLYADHLAALQKHAASVLAATGHTTLAVAAGRAVPKFLDDQALPYIVHPHFKHWLPLADAPGSWVIFTAGHKPKLIFMQPRDFWYPVPEAPTGYWVDHFDIVTVANKAELAAALPADTTGWAIIGQPQDAVDAFAPNNPEGVMARLHFARARKSAYELELMREANRIGTRAHLAALAAFNAGASEFDIHMAFLKAAREVDAELPYHSIVALNEHGAVLHYDAFDRTAPAAHRSMLIDAGASFAGYASDITRTYASAEAGEFQALIDAMEANQRELRNMVRAGTDYADIHLRAHHLVASTLKDQDFLRMAPDEAVAAGVTGTFLPHGVGHLIGAQVHDIGGFQKAPEGGRIEPPEGHPFLRMTRVLEPGMVVTIEPGLYFIGMLLEKLKARPEGRHVNWDKVDHFRPYGGIRIEDNVACTEGEPENLTRDAFKAHLAG